MEVAAKQRKVAVELGQELADAVARHRLLTFASAVSFRALVALVPLILLGLGVLGALGQASVWSNSIAPAIEGHVTRPVFHAVDYSAKKIFASESGPLLVFAALLTIWYVSGGVRAIMGGINRVYETDENRPFWIRRSIIRSLNSRARSCARVTTPCCRPASAQTDEPTG